MVQNWIIRILLLPFSILYGILSFAYSKLFDIKLLASIKFVLPVISIGNLSVGGTGKTPHTEYLINLLKPYIKIAVLSRGYKRNSKGFQIVSTNSTVSLAGDEPLLFKKKYPDIGVFVSENRVEGISQLLMKEPDIQTILLDDAFQHRAIDPALNILLTEYDYPFFTDFFLPSGRLREWRSAYKRANVIIVTKCPLNLTQDDRKVFLEKLNPLSHQRVFFSYYRYFDPYYIYDNNVKVKLKSDTSVLLISAIASTSYLKTYFDNIKCDVHLMEYTDHHQFTFDEIEQLNKIYNSLTSPDKIIITTEKDAMRLDTHRKYILDNKLPVFVLPISVDFLFGEKDEFDLYVKNFLLEFKS